MDTVSAMLGAHRGQGAFVLRCTMAPPWSVRIADQAAVALVVMVEGTVCIARPGTGTGTGTGTGPVVRLGPGDAAIIKGARPYLLADDPKTPPVMVIEPGQVCRPLPGSAAGATFEFDPERRSWGNDRAGPTSFVVGIYEVAGQVSGRLLHAVADVLVVRADETNAAAIALLGAEVGRDAPGQGVVLDRLVDLILVGTVRTWLTRAGTAAPPWWRAQQDPVIAAALELIHDEPGRHWTLASLADEVAVSRATLARRFTQLLGQPPMAYLTEWRLATAADLLRDTTTPIEQIAHQIGYANAFAFSTAFKRCYGHAPRAHRRGEAVPAVQFEQSAGGPA